MNIFFDEKKAAHSMGYLCSLSRDNTISSLKLLKLIYLSDRESIRENGYPIQIDEYRSLKNGPVNYRLHKYISKFDYAEIKEFHKILEKKKDNTFSLKEGIKKDDLLSLSEGDINIFDKIYDKFGSFSTKEIIDWTHNPNNIPEWNYDNRNKKIKLYKIYEAVGNDEEEAKLIADDVIHLQKMRVSFF